MIYKISKTIVRLHNGDIDFHSFVELLQKKKNQHISAIYAYYLPRIHSTKVSRSNNKKIVSH